MNLLDMRTVILSYAISDLICIVVIAILWKQNRRRFPGLGFWLADFVMQFIALALVALRGIVPDFLSMTVSNAMIIGGTILLLIGLEHFTGKRGPQVHNYILLAVFIAVHAYFVFIHPNLVVRNILFSLGLSAVCIHAAWLMLRQVEQGMRSITRGVGQIFLGFCLISIGRITVDLIVPSGNDFFHSNTYDTLLLMTYQMLFVILTFSLFLMVNRRLFADMEGDIIMRKQVENALRQSEAHFREVFDNTAHGTFIIEVTEDGNFRIGDSNKAEEILTTIHREDVMGKSLEDAFPPEIAQALHTNYSRCLEAGESIAYEEEINLPGAGQRFYYTALAPVRDESGHFYRIIGSTLEITDRKQMEENLRLSEEKFFKAFHASPDAITISRLSDGRLVDVNEGFSHLMEYSREEALASSSINLSLWVDSQDREKCIAALRKNQRIRDHEYDFRTKSGRILNGLYSGELIQFGDEVHVLSVVRDITERKRYEDALHKQTVALTERVKELNCIGELAHLIEIPGVSLDEILRGSVNILQTAMQYPEFAGVKLVIGEQTYTTENYQASTRKLLEDIMDIGRTIGVLEVCYPEEIQQEQEYLFLEEEKSLLHIVAERLGHLCKRIWTEEALRESEKLLRAVAENYPHSYLSIINRDLTVGFTSGQEFKKQNLDPNQFVGLTLEQVFGDKTDIVREHYLNAFEGNETTFELSVNGQHQLYKAVPLFAPDGSIPRILSVVENITERKRAEEIFQMRFRLLEFAVAHSLEEFMQRALDEIGHIINSPISFYHFVEADQKTLSLQAWSTRTLEEFCRAEGKGMHYDIDRAGVWVDCVRQRKPVIHNNYATLPHRKGLPDGHAEVIRELVVPVLRQERVVSILGVGNKPTDYDDKDIELVTYIADVVWEIVRRKRAEEKLQQLSRAVEQSPASIVITDTTGSIEYVNPKFTEITGYSLEEAVGKNPRILKTSHTPKETHYQLWETITSGREWRGEFVNRKKNGELFNEAASISPIIDNGVTTHFVAVKEDITATKLNEQKLQQANQQLQLQLDQIQSLQIELREQVIRDPLTGLYNRRYLDETLKRELARAVRENYPISFVMIDIDHFKKINDTFGHGTGDIVLQKLATQLLAQTRVVDIACRYGGEEFLIILPNAAVAIAFQIAERWRKSFMGMTMPLGYSGVQTTISCGICEFPLNGNTVEELISTADKAMYHAKATGRNRVVIWQNEMNG